MKTPYSYIEQEEVKTQSIAKTQEVEESKEIVNALQEKLVGKGNFLLMLNYSIGIGNAL